LGGARRGAMYPPAPSPGVDHPWRAARAGGGPRAPPKTPHPPLHPSPPGCGPNPNPNRYTLLAAVEDAGGIVIDAGVARDERADLIERLKAAGDTDLVVTTGGVSMGAYDLVRGVLEEREAVTFWQVALRPGKPLMFATVAGVPLIGLPGNPV